MTAKQNKLIALCTVLFLLFGMSGCKQNTTSDSSGASSSQPPTSSSATFSVPLSTSGKLTVMYWNVGQGDSMFISLPDGKTVLVDAGTKENSKPIVSYLINNGINKIDYLIATHSHADHIGGLDEVLSSLQIGKLFYPNIPSDEEPDSKEYKKFMTAVSTYQYKLIAPKSGTVMFEGQNYKAECLGPISSKYSDLNSYSIVFKLTYGSNTFLFMGDSLKENERELLAAKYDIKADVLKVGHHGDNDASSKNFLAAVGAKYAVIPCSGDTKNHPDADTQAKISSFGAKVYRTDQNGTTVITSDGKNLTVTDHAIGPNGN